MRTDTPHPVARLLLATMLALPALAGDEAGRPIPETMSAELLPGYRVVTPILASAGKPTAEGLEKIAAAGFRTVVDLLPPEEAVAGEREALERLGLRYVSIPVTVKSLDWKQAQELRAIVDDPQSAPVLVHCASGNRVGGVWALVSSMRGMSTGEAEAEGRRAGMKSAELVARVEELLAAPPRPLD